jgi:glycosyltransferase involved in cell wall biosynthesis
VHIAFLTLSSWQQNAAWLRPQAIGHALAELGHDVSYVVDDCAYNREHLDLHPSANVVYVERADTLAQLRTRRRAVTRLDADWLYVCNSHAKTFAALALRRSLRIVGQWDEPPMLKAWPVPRRQLEAQLDRWLARRADRSVVCARALQPWFAERYGVTPPYLPHAAYLDGDADRRPSPFAEPTAVYLGSFIPEWDHDLIFEAARQLAAEGKRPKICFVGGGGEEQRWRAFVAEQGLDNVVFAGWQEGEDLMAHLRGAHVNLFPIRDTLVNRTRCPSKLFAYAQAQRPVIANRVGEVPYVLGDAAQYVEADAAAFGEAIDASLRAGLVAQELIELLEAPGG